MLALLLLVVAIALPQHSASVTINPTDSSSGTSSSPALSAATVAFIVIGCLVPTAGMWWCLFNRFLLGRRPLSNDEEIVITDTIQLALRYWHQGNRERRAQARANLPKPVKQNLHEIGTVVLDDLNKEQLLTRSNDVPAIIESKNDESKLNKIETSDDDADDADDDDNAEPPVDALVQARSLARVASKQPTHPLQDSPAPPSTNECCSICIEEFAVGDTVRVLPACRHVFHADCVDPWLTTTSALCPLCKTDTRTTSEVEEYKTTLATATANSNSRISAAAALNIHNEVKEIFEVLIDEICLERLGRVIERERPVCISASYDNGHTVVVYFTTNIFTRRESINDNGDNQRGWWARFVYKLKNRDQHPYDLHVIIQRRGSTSLRSNQAILSLASAPLQPLAYGAGI